MTELRPCPFCGGEAHLQPFMGYWTVGCTDCFGAVVGKIETKEEAIKEWNKRPSPWHTGTPTETGRYLVSNGYDTSISYFDGKSIIKNFLAFPDVGEIVKWQKIDEGEK